MVYVGIDFGTSYSAAAVVIDSNIVHIHFGESKQFRTAVFFPEVVPDPNDFELSPGLEEEYEAQLRSLRAQQRRLVTSTLAHGQYPLPRSESELQRDALRIVRRQWMEEQTRTAATAVTNFQHALFGDEAVDAYLEYGDGNLIESPKSLLGYRLDPQVRKIIVHITTHILEHIRLTASHQLGAPVRGAVIGRPVHFRSSMGEKGSVQAVEIIREAASAAGFDAVSFLEEPAAAAMHYHKSLAVWQRALIVDIGGGTTDVAYAELGGGIPSRIIHSWGLARGGTDLDVNLSLRSFMPMLGYQVAKVPAHHYVEAASVYNLPKQREFRKQDYRLVDEPYGSRLRALQQPGATTRLNRMAEHGKIVLSTKPRHHADLTFLDPDLWIETHSGDLQEASALFLERLQQCLAEVRRELTTLPESVFLTGGTSRSPHVEACVRACFPGIPLVKGDPSLGVVSGLAIAASEA